MADGQTFTAGGITVGQLRNLRPGTPALPTPPEPRKLGALQELVRAPFALGGGAIRGVGQLAADTPLTEQGNLLQRVGQGIQERNASDIQGFGDIADRPVAAAGAVAGSVLGSVAAFKAPSVIGTALTALSVPAAFVPYAGPALSTILRGAGTALRVGGAAGAALGTASSLGTMAAAQFAQDRAEQIAQDPANAESLGAKAAAGANAIFSGLVESRFGVEAGLARSALGKTLLDEVKDGTRRQLIGRSALRFGGIEALEETAQAVGSQLATFKNPLTADSLEDTAFQTVMGLGGGGMFGAVRGAIANPGTVSNDDLKGAVDPALNPETPPPPPPAPLLALPAPTDFVGTADGELARPGQIEAEQQQVMAAIEARAAELEAAGRTEDALNLRGSAYGLLAPGQGVQAMMGLMSGTSLPEQSYPTSADPAAARSLFFGGMEPGQGVQAMMGLMPGSTAPVQRGVPQPDPDSMGALFGQVPAANIAAAQPSASVADTAPTPFRAILASSPDISLKGVPSTLRKTLDAAATPEDVAAIAAQEYHSRMTRNSNANYVHEPNGLLQSLYRTVTGGQEIPSRAEFEAQQQAQEVAAQEQQVQPTVQPEVVQVPAQEVQPQTAAQPQAEQTATPAIQQPQPQAPKLTKAQERVRAADRSALEVSRKEADAAAQKLMDDELTKGERKRAEAAIDRFEKKQAEFDAKYGPRASQGTQPAATPHTVTTIREALTDILGRSAMTRLARKFVIVHDVQAMRDDMDRRGSPYSTRVDGTEKGLYDPSTDTSYIIASNMSATDSPWGVFLHEVGVHYGLRGMLGAKGHAATLRDVNRLLREGDAAMVAAAQRVNQLLRDGDAALVVGMEQGGGLRLEDGTAVTTEAQRAAYAKQISVDPADPEFATKVADLLLGQPQLGEEVVGYFAENPANHTRSVWKRIVTAVKNFLRSIGINRPVTADDIAVTVIASARQAAQGTSAVTPDTMARDAQEVLQQFGYTTRTLQDGTVDILDANGQVVADEDIADTAQLAATIVKYPDMREQLAKDVTETGPLFSRSTATGPTSADTQETLNQYGQATNSLRALGAQGVSRLTKGNRDTISAKLLRVAARWADREHLVEMYDDRYGGALRKNATTYANQEVIASRFNQLFNNPYQKLEALERNDPKTHAALTNLMTATELQIDPRKSWEDQPHLHALPETEQAAVKSRVTKFKQSWGLLSPEHKQIYNDLVDMNEMMFMADMAVTLQNITHANIPEGSVPADLQTDITDAFRNRPDTHESIAAAKKYWAGELDRYTKAVAKYAADQRVNIPTKAPQTPELKAATAAALKGIPPGPARDKIKRDLARGREAQLTAEQKQIVRRLSPLEAQVKIIAEGLSKIAKAPYFHLGRFGDYFISTKVRLGEDGKADPVAMKQVSETLGKAFPEISIRMDATDPIIVTRFESVDTAQSFVAALKKLQVQGLLQQDINEAAYVKGVKSQVRGKPVTPEWLQQAIEGIHAEDYGDASDGGEGQRIADQLISDLRRMYLESLPDLSSAKVMAQRTGRQGYSTDMVRSFAHRMRVASVHIAGTAVSPARRASMKQVRDVQYAAQQNPSISLDEQNKLGIIADEFRQREIDLDNMPQTPGLAMLRAASHAFFLAMSPAYMLLNVSQVGAVAWPELTKRFGGVKAFNALVRVTPMAGKVVRAAITEGYKARGVRGALDAVVTSDILKAAGIPTDVAEYLVEMMGTGKLDIGNATRELARVAEGEIGGPNSERASEVLRLATSTSYMSEIFSRTIVALAARELNGVDGAVPYAARVLDQAMLNYNFTNLGRATGKKGIFGEFTPVVVQFHQYQFQMLAKLYREIYRGSGLGKNVTPTQQAEARQFLKAHAAAVTLLAGTMGLPFMTVAARLSDMLCEMFSDQPCDTKASIRNFTSDIVGEDIEPLISRGLPRLLGADISDRAGEANLFPGSRFIEDRRTLTEKLKNPSIAISGAAGGMMASIIEGIQLAADGDWLGGMQRALPLAIQGPIKAYQLSEQGFTDRAGNKLPMTPHALEILGQTLGFQPGQKADYSQAARSQQQRAAILTREGALIRRNLAVAFERGDREAMLEWGRKAEDFARRHPNMDVLPGLGSSIRQRQRARALAEAGVPPGANVRDVGAFGATRFFQPEAVQ